MDGVPVMQTAHRFLLHEDSAIKENDSHQQSLTVIFNMPHLQLARVLFCFVLWTRKNSLTGCSGLSSEQEVGEVDTATARCVFKKFAFEMEANTSPRGRSS